MIIMLSQVPYKSFTVSSGNVYVADQYGVIPNVQSTADQNDLASAGCATLAPNATDLLGYIIGANMNSTADQLFANLNNSVRYQIRRITVLNASISLTTAAGGVWTGAGGTGTNIVSAGQVYSALTAPGIALDLTLAAINTWRAAADKLYLKLATPQGAPATADIFVYGDALPTS